MSIARASARSLGPNDGDTPGRAGPADEPPAPNGGINTFRSPDSRVEQAAAAGSPPGRAGRFRRYRVRGSIAIPRASKRRLPSLDAVGLLMELADLDDEEQTSAEAIAEQLPGTGRRTAAAAMATLVTYGFVIKVRFQGERGRWCTDTLHQDTPFTDDDLTDIAAAYGPGVVIQCWAGDYGVTAERSLFLKSETSTATRATPPACRPTACGTSARAGKTPRNRSPARPTANRPPAGGGSSLSSVEGTSTEVPSTSSDTHGGSPTPDAATARTRRRTDTPKTTEPQRGISDIIACYTNASLEEATQLANQITSDTQVRSPARYVRTLVDNGDIQVRLERLRNQTAQAATESPEHGTRVTCCEHDAPVPCIPCRCDLLAGDTARPTRALGEQGPGARPDLATLLNPPDTETAQK